MTQSSVTPAHASSTRVDDTTVALRNFAFARCVALAFNDNETARTDAEAASSVYAASARENDADIYQHMDTYANSWLTLPYQSLHTRRRLNLVACIDFQQSADMTTLPADYPVPNYDAATQLRNYVLASCVAQVLDDKIVRDDARSATTAYIEFGKNGIDDFRLMGEFTRERLKQVRMVSSNNASKLVTCMDIYRSAEVSDAIERYTNETAAYLRSFALYQCLTLAVDDYTDQADLSAMMNETLASGHVNADAQEKLSHLAKEWLKNYEPSDAGGEFKCDELYNSAELLDAVVTHAGLSQ